MCQFKGLPYVLDYKPQIKLFLHWVNKYEWWRPAEIANEFTGEYSGAVYTVCPVVGNRHSALMETIVP